MSASTDAPAAPRSAPASGPRVSIGLPVRNGASYVRECIEGLLAQDFDDFELIISDNASTDRTEELCRAAAESDPRIRYIRQAENRGLSFNFNTVFWESRAPYFKWATHDDRCRPGYLRACVDILDQQPESVVLAYPRTVLIDPEGRWLEDYEDGMDMRQQLPSDRLQHLLKHLRLCHCGLGLIRRSALEQTRLIGGFESSDIVMLVELALRGQFHEHGEFLYERRIHPASSFQSYSNAQEFAATMDPARRGAPVPLPRTHLYIENSRAIERAPISRSQKLRSHWHLFANWGPRFWRVIGGEFKRRLFWELRRLRARST